MDFKWLNEGQMKEENNKIEMIAPAQSDFFFNNGAIGDEGITPESLCNAPFYYTEIAGDFVMRVKVAHDFKDTYDSASIMVMQDMRNWAKACFEMTDFGTHAVVSVIARNGESDDANGCNIDGNDVRQLVAQHNTVVIVEHRLELIAQADWIIDMGPEGGSEGGEVLFCGTPDELIHCSASKTGNYLSKTVK